jgi:hypothetical protein
MPQSHNDRDHRFDDSITPQDVQDYTRSTEKRAKEHQTKAVSRRALIAMGWAVPVVMSVSLAKPAKASGGPTGGKGNNGVGIGVGGTPPGRGGGLVNNPGTGAANGGGSRPRR